MASPASAFAHDRVTNPYLHALLDVLSLGVVTAPLWTAYFWGPKRRGALIALVAAIQLPVAVVAFVPITDPALHAVALTSALVLTVGAVALVRRAVREERTAVAVQPTS